MLCLGIETSCDETGLALVEDSRLLHSVLASQADLHSLFGGVVPELASREHYRFIGALFDELIESAKVTREDLDYICVARGPGLLGSLLVGVAFAKGLALALGKPFLGVNHLHAHILATGLCHALPFPFLGLLASGGHTCLYRVESPHEFECLGRCLDDAAGEAFDKIGKELGLPYPAGKKIDELAQIGKSGTYALPRPYLDNDNLDFSFSGLKTAAAQYIGQRNPAPDWYAESKTSEESKKDLENFCASFNEAIVDTLCAKLKRALARHRDARAIVLAGGVAANSLLRARAADLSSLPVLFPDPALCTDNGAMIAYAGWQLARMGFFHDLDMETIPRGRYIPQDMQRLEQRNG